MDESEQRMEKDWREQAEFEHHAEERRQFDQYMWQIPVAAIGVVAISLSGGSEPSPKAYIVLAGLCLYSLLLLGRMLVRRRQREKRMRELVPNLLRDPKEPGSIMAKLTNCVAGKVGKVGTTVLGATALMLTAAMLIGFVVVEIVSR